MDPSTDARTEQELRDSLAAVRSRIVEELRSGDALTGREIAGNAAGGVLLGLGVILALVGLDLPGGDDPYLPAVPLGVVVLVLAWLAFRPWLRRQRALWRSVRGLNAEAQQLREALPPGADAGPRVLRMYYGRRFGPLLIGVFALMALLLVLRLSR